MKLMMTNYTLSGRQWRELADLSKVILAPGMIDLVIKGEVPKSVPYPVRVGFQTDLNTIRDLLLSGF